MQWYLLAIISALFSAGAAILEKKILFKERALSFSSLLAIFNLIIAIPFFFFTDLHVLTMVSLLVLLFKSFLGALAFLCVMLGIKNLELSKALPLLVLTPGLVAIGGFIFLKEALTSLEVVGIILLLIGTYILQLKSRQKFFDPWKSYLKAKGNYYIFFALILFTITSLLDKAILSSFNLHVNAFMGFQHLFLAIIFLAFLLFTGKARELKSTIKYSWLMILFLGFVTIIYRYAQIAAVKEAPVALVLSLKRISVFFAVLIGGKLFKEKHLLIRLIATGVMIAGAILIIIY